MTTLATSPAYTNQDPLLRSWRRTLTRPWESTQGCIFLLTAWCVLLFFYGMNAGDLWRTEGLRAIVAQEMLRDGNWIVPTLYGEPFLTKPPGMYLAIMLCSWPLGVVTDWSSRLPSALAATLTVFLFFAFFKRYLGRLGGLVAALILPMSPMWLEKSPAAEIDMLQVAWVTASILCLLRAVEESEGSRQEAGGRKQESGVGSQESGARAAGSWFLAPGSYWYLAMLAMAGGLLTKWTAPAFLYATAIPLLWWRGRLRLLFCRHHLLGLLLAATICLGWVLAAISVTGWDVLYETVKREGLARLVPNYDGHRPYRISEALLHPFKLLLTTLPWSIVALYALSPRFYRLWDARGRFLLQALHAWTWPNMLVWSYMSEHTPRHSFPLFPGISGLAAMVWFAWHELKAGAKPQAAILRPDRVLVGALVVWLAIKMVFVEVIMTGTTMKVLGFTINSGRSIQRGAREKGELLARLVPEGSILYLFRLKDEGIMFYYGRPVVRLRSWAEVPESTGAVYCIIVPGEWDQRDPARPMEVVQHMVDEQGADMTLVRVGARSASK